MPRFMEGEDRFQASLFPARLDDYIGEAKQVRMIDAVVDEMDVRYEIVLVEDGSPDRSWDRIVQQCERHTHVKGVRLSRNFGQHYAITAGIEGFLAI